MYAGDLNLLMHERNRKNFSGAGLKIGVVLSRFNSDIGEGLLNACIKRIVKTWCGECAITIATAPEALETPLLLQHMAFSEGLMY